MPATAPAILRNTRFDNGQFNALGIEWMALSDLMQRVPPEVMRLPERLDFYMLLLVTAGRGTHMVDFVESVLSPGTVVFVRPGQVQQWHLDQQLAGTLVLVAAQALTPAGAERNGEGLGMDVWPSIFDLPALMRDEIEASMASLALDFARFQATPLDATLIRHDVRGVLIRLARCLAAMDEQGASRQAEQVVYRLFLRELETGFRERQGVQHYAARLGYSESTLTRACKVAEGRSAKQVIDRRIALEAGRELVHGDGSVAEIAHRLGFSEATNFVKFFVRMHGLAPLAFRRKMGLR